MMRLKGCIIFIQQTTRLWKVLHWSFVAIITVLALYLHRSRILPPKLPTNKPLCLVSKHLMVRQWRTEHLLMPVWAWVEVALGTHNDYNSPILQLIYSRRVCSSAWWSKKWMAGFLKDANGWTHAVTVPYARKSALLAWREKGSWMNKLDI